MIKYLSKSFPGSGLNKSIVFIDSPFCLLPFYFCLATYLAAFSLSCAIICLIFSASRESG